MLPFLTLHEFPGTCALLRTPEPGRQAGTDETLVRCQLQNDVHAHSAACVSRECDLLLQCKQGGALELNGQTPLQLGVTRWRTLVTYVPQTRVQPKGTPAEFYFSVQVHKTSLDPELPAVQALRH